VVGDNKLKIVSFNVNSIRTRLHQLEKLVEKHSPDIIALQETKVQDHEFPLDEIERLGYHAEFMGQKTHYGVATLSKTKPKSVQKGFPADDADAQKRMLMCAYDNVSVINGYFPQGENRGHEIKFPAKAKFYADMLEYLKRDFNKNDNIIVLGDMNIAPTDYDIGIGEQNAKRWLKEGKTSFLPEEREWMGRFFDWGLTDVYRKLYPESMDFMSWFDYRSKGFEAEPKRGLRIDLILATASLAGICAASGIDYEIRGMDRPSDHAPVWAEFSL